MLRMNDVQGHGVFSTPRVEEFGCGQRAWNYLPPILKSECVTQAFVSALISFILIPYDFVLVDSANTLWLGLKAE
jgi:hypothetical protein